jgi:hypothetical protein
MLIYEARSEHWPLRTGDPDARPMDEENDEEQEPRPGSIRTEPRGEDYAMPGKPGGPDWPPFDAPDDEEEEEDEGTEAPSKPDDDRKGA